MGIHKQARREAENLGGYNGAFDDDDDDDECDYDDERGEGLISSVISLYDTTFYVIEYDPKQRRSTFERK